MKPQLRLDPIALLGLGSIAVLIAITVVIEMLGVRWSRYSGAILLVHAPMVVAGLIMASGVWLARWKARTGRIVSTVGAVLAMIMAGCLGAGWMALDQGLIGLALMIYAALHVVAIGRIWDKDNPSRYVESASAA